VPWDDGFAASVKGRIDAGQEVSPEDLSRFVAMVDEAAAGAQRPTPRAAGPDWTDAQAHDVYTRINRDPASVTDGESQQFAAWAAQRTSGPALERGQVPPVPGPDASIEERHAYINAAHRSNVEPDPATVAAFNEQVGQALKDHTAALEARFPPGFFDDGRPKPPSSEQAMREELHALYARQQQDPASVTAADWAAITGRLDAAVAEYAADYRQRKLPWVLDTPGDPGVEPGAVEAMTAPAPWTPRQPTGTEQHLASLDQLEQEAAAIDQGDDAV
jgi:hypothetical protein